MQQGKRDGTRRNDERDGADQDDRSTTSMVNCRPSCDRRRWDRPRWDRRRWDRNGPLGDERKLRPGWKRHRNRSAQHRRRSKTNERGGGELGLDLFAQLARVGIVVGRAVILAARPIRLPDHRHVAGVNSAANASSYSSLPTP
jgi:hypothetical protein